MKIKDELMQEHEVCVEVKNAKQWAELSKWLEENTDVLWRSGAKPTKYPFAEGNVFIYFKQNILTRSLFSGREKIYKYNEIWESNEEDLIAERMQTIAGMLDIPMDTDIVLTKNGSKLIYTPHQLTNEGLLNFMGTKVNDILGNLLIGRYEIEQVPFKDRIKEGDKYYYIETDGLVECAHYNNFDFQKRMIEIGNFFETKEEASKYELKIVEKEGS